MAGGRPSKYDTKMNEQVYKLCLLGATDKEIADFFGVCEATINNWKLESPQFLESLKAGKEKADCNVVESLYKRALGYSHPEEKIFQYEGSIIRAETIRHYPPDSTSIIFWLKNRRTEQWRDVKEHKHEGEVVFSEKLKGARDRVESRISKYSEN